MDEAILGSSAACAAADRGLVLQPRWAHGAKVLVEGLGVQNLAAEGVDCFCPKHVLVSLEDEDSIHAALATLSYRVRPRLKPGCGRRELGIRCGSGSGGSHAFCRPSDDAFLDEMPVV